MNNLKKLGKTKLRSLKKYRFFQLLRKKLWLPGRIFLEGKYKQLKRNQQVKFKISRKDKKNRNVIIVAVDCLRRDHLDLYGYHRETAPFLKQLATTSLVAEDHYSSAPWTWPSVNTILTGLYPRHSGAITGEDFRWFNKKTIPSLVRENVTTFADIARETGMSTAMISAVVTADIALRGVFDNRLGSEDDSVKNLFSKAVQFLQKNKSRSSFVYIQPGDPHQPINLPDKYYKLWGGIDKNIKGLSTWRYKNRNDVIDDEFPEYKENRIKLYDASIKYVDDAFCFFYKELEEKGLLDDSLIVFTADHGEELWDHFELEKELYNEYDGRIGVDHGHSLFAEALAVPLLIHDGRTKKGEKISQPTSHIDIVPTLLDTLDLDVNVSFDGVSMLQPIDSDRVLFAEELAYGYEQKSVIQNNKQYIVSNGDGFELLIDLENQEVLENEATQMYEDLLGDFISDSSGSGRKTDIDNKVKKRLEGLGYM